MSNTAATKRMRPVSTPMVCANHTLRGSPTASDTERCWRVHQINIPSDIRVRIAYQLRRIPRTALVDTVTRNRVISASHREMRPMNPPIPYAKKVDNHTLMATIHHVRGTSDGVKAVQRPKRAKMRPAMLARRNAFAGQRRLASRAGSRCFGSHGTIWVVSAASFQCRRRDGLHLPYGHTLPRCPDEKNLDIPCEWVEARQYSKLVRRRCAAGLSDDLPSQTPVGTCHCRVCRRLAMTCRSW